MQFLFMTFSTTQNLLQSLSAPQASGFPRKAVIVVKSGTWPQKLAFKSSRKRNKSEVKKRKNASQSAAPSSSEQYRRQGGLLFTWFTFSIN